MVLPGDCEVGPLNLGQMREVPETTTAKAECSTDRRGPGRELWIVSGGREEQGLRRLQRLSTRLGARGHVAHRVEQGWRWVKLITKSQGVQCRTYVSVCNLFRSWLALYSLPFSCCSSPVAVKSPALIIRLCRLEAQTFEY